MTTPVNIHPDVAYRELAVQHEFLKQRALFLAQSLAVMTAERDQAAADRDAARKELEDLQLELKERPHGAAE